MFDRLAQELVLVLLASLRLGPIFMFAPPFTLIKIPGPVRLVLIVGLGAALVTKAAPGGSDITDLAELMAAGVGELALGIALALPLQLAFAAIAIAARTLDIQAGFGLALLIDPTTRAQTPLLAAIFGYAAAAIFLCTSGPHDLLAVLSRSFEHVPVGTATGPQQIEGLLAFLGTIAILAFGAVGLAVLVLFLLDLVVAVVSRTLPQMNVLVLGFQMKSIAILLVMPATLALAAAVLAQILRLSLDAMMTGF